jgi:hypothetical protein
MLNGGLKGLFFGGSGSYQREHDRVTQAMRQSVYMSGFRDGQSKLGWVYRAPSFTDTIRPGVYSTFAVVLVPKGCKLSIDRGWRWNDKKGKLKEFVDTAAFSPAAEYPGLDMNDPPRVLSVQYDPHYASPDDLQTDVNVITVDFERPINPNLMIAAAGKLLKRVRDWRGRATAPSTTDIVSVSDSAGTSHQISRARGLFEADIDEADTWIAVTQSKIMLKLKYGTAGSIVFPEIRLLTPGNESWNLQQLVDYRNYSPTITIGQREFLACHPKRSAAKDDNVGCMRQPYSMWLPLFVVQPSNGHTLRLAGAKADAPDNSGMPGQVYFFLSADDGRTSLAPRSQVVLSLPGHSRFPHPIPVECSGLLGGLLCHTHPQSMFYGAEQCMKPAAGGGPSTLNTSVPECSIENYNGLRVDVIQPGTKANPTFFASTTLPKSAVERPVIGGVSSFARQTGRLRYTFPVYGLNAGAPVEIRKDGAALQGAAASVSEDPASGVPVLSVIVNDGQAVTDAVLGGPPHLFSNNVDLGPLIGMQDPVLPTNVDLTVVQNHFYQFSGTHLESVDRLFVGDSAKELMRFEAGLIADIGDQPEKDSLLSFQIAGVKRPVNACVTQTKPPEKPAQDAGAAKPDKPKPDKPKTPKPDDKALEVTTTTRVKTGSGETAETSSANDDSTSANKPAATPQAQRVCGPIIVTAKPKDGGQKPNTATAPAALVISIPAALSSIQLAPPQQDAAKQIYLAPEPVKK